MTQTEELIEEIRTGLLRWYDFKSDSAILYFGKEQDSCAILLKEHAE